MGASFAQVQSPQTSGGKGSPMSDGQLPPAPATYNPAAGGPNMQNQGQMPVNPGAMSQGKGAGVMGSNPNPAGFAGIPNQQSQATSQNPAIDSTVVNEKKTIFNPGINTFPDPRSQQPQGKGGASTNSATSGQPRMGQPNNYTNTVGGWDNASIQPQRSGGKGKGG